MRQAFRIQQMRIKGGMHVNLFRSSCLLYNVLVNFDSRAYGLAIFMKSYQSLNIIRKHKNPLVIYEKTKICMSNKQLHEKL